MPLSELLKIFGKADWKKKIKNEEEYVSESVFDFDAWQEATARQVTRPFDKDIMEH